MNLCKTKEEVLALIKKEGIRVIDIRFTDLLGTWQHISYPSSQFDLETFEAGLGFDGSSIRGWKAINESDMLIRPIPETCFIDPFMAEKTLVMSASIIDPITKQHYSRDPRYIAQKATEYVKASAIGDTAFIGPEAEFFIFDTIRYDQNGHSAFYEIDSNEGGWNTGSDEYPNLGYKIRNKEGYFPCPPTDQLQDIRTEMMLTMEDLGIEMEAQHHEVATAGQSEIDMRFDNLLKMADKMMLYKYVVRNVAFQNGKTVTFMPKPLFGDNGSGMHVHLSIWKNGKNLFAGDGYAGMSEIAMYAIGGILKHTKALLAFTNPTTNSYKRLVPGYEAPVNLAYSSRNRSAAIRIPSYHTSEKAKRFEFRCPDPTANPYLAYTAIVMAALDGIQNKIHPGDPLDKNIYDLPPEEAANVETTPPTLAEALQALEADHEFLLKGDVFTQDVIDAWIEYKIENEVKPMALRPHPYEFALYYNA